VLPHPLEHVPDHRATLVGRILLFATLAVIAPLALMNDRIRNDTATAGIVSLAFAGTPEPAHAILRSWDEPDRIWAAFGLGFDFLALVTYSTTIAFFCVQGAQFGRRTQAHTLAAVGTGLAWGQWGAALCDMLENGLLLTLLSGQVTGPITRAASIAATAKFALIVAGLLYAIGTTRARRAAEL